jgi:hypothetical protein
MTSTQPIDLDTFMFEDDLYGEQAKIEETDPIIDPEPNVPMKPQKKSPYAKPVHRRHPEDADTEDRVLVKLVDEGWSWEYVI